MCLRRDFLTAYLSVMFRCSGVLPGTTSCRCFGLDFLRDSQHWLLTADQAIDHCLGFSEWDRFSTHAQSNQEVSLIS